MTNLTGIYSRLDDNRENLWESFVKIFDIPKYQNELTEVIKKDIPKDRAKAIPYFCNINFRNLVYYLNVMRTDANAQAFYVPARKVKTKVDFFEASDSPVNQKDRWNLYLKYPMKTQSIKGDHFSIFNPGYVEEFSMLFNNILNQVVK